MGHVGGDERLTLEEARELLIDARAGVVAVHDRVRGREPVAQLALVHAASMAGHVRRRRTQVPSCHHVRVGVVVDVLVVLIRADHVADVTAAVRVAFDAGLPVARGLDEDRHPVAAREFLVAGPG